VTGVGGALLFFFAQKRSQRTEPKSTKNSFRNPLNEKTYEEPLSKLSEESITNYFTCFEEMKEKENRAKKTQSGQGDFST